MEFDLKISENQIGRVFTEICSFSPRWQGDKGQENVLIYLEQLLRDEFSVEVFKEDFSYLGFHPQKAELKILDPSGRSISCQPLAYSASEAIDEEIVYIPEDKLGLGNFSGKVVLTDALKSYQAYPQAVQGRARGFILGNNLEGNLLRVGATNYERHLGSIPAIAVGAKDTQTLKESASRGLKVHLEVVAHSGEEIGYNLSVRLRGHRNKPKILICSHYDSMWMGPHALDNASGTAAIVELIRYFKGLPYNIDFLLCGAEELGFWGSRAYFEKHRDDLLDLRAVICLDGICSDLGPVEVGATENLVPIIKKLALQHNLQIDKWSIPPRPNSDHVSFEPLGVPTFWLTTMDPYYHTAADIPENISPKKMASHTAFVGKVIMNFSEEPRFESPDHL